MDKCYKSFQIYIFSGHITVWVEKLKIIHVLNICSYNIIWIYNKFTYNEDLCNMFIITFILVYEMYDEKKNKNIY